MSICIGKKKILLLLLLLSYACSSKKQINEARVKKIIIIDSNLPWEDHRIKDIQSLAKPSAESKLLKDYIESKGFSPYKDGQSEFDFFRQSMEWVTKQWNHHGFNQPPSNFTSLDILKSVHDKGERYRCVEYGRVLEDILLAYGNYTRSVGLVSEDVEYGGLGKGHVATEIWSNDLKKWIFFDPQFGVYIENLPNIPLSYYEIFKEYQENGWNNLYVRFLVPVDSKNAAKEYQDFLSNYFGAMNTTLGDQAFILGLKKTKPYIVFQGMPGVFRFFTTDPKIVYPVMNQTIIKINYDYDQPDYNKVFAELDSSLPLAQLQKQYLDKLPHFAAKPIFKLHFSNTTPLFSHYEILSNGSDWKKIDTDNTSWEILNEGTHTFKARLVDKFGKRGPASFITISYLADEL